MGLRQKKTDVRRGMCEDFYAMKGGVRKITCNVTSWSQDSGIDQRNVYRNKSNRLSLKNRNNGASWVYKNVQHLKGVKVFDPQKGGSVKIF